MKRALLILFCAFFIQQLALAETQEKKQYMAKNINPKLPVIDGKLGDPVWQDGKWGDGFTQREPYEGKSPTQRIAEMRIPLSQLRYGKEDDQAWGLQVTRNLFRKEEISNWQFIPRDAGGWVHAFGELRGLNGLKAARQIELYPYSVGQIQSYEREEGNPFATGQTSNFMAGLDGKVGLTINLTLDFTLNPDFGQVEADPSVVNLTAFETYFEEKRPFFIEKKIFSLSG
jgi:hypothetical protein